MRLVLLGAPGSGKGTIAQELSGEYDAAHISTGDIFRSNMRENTPLGREAKRYIERGDLVPDDVTVNMIRERLGQGDCTRGFILDGFPRNLPQALELEKILQESGASLDGVICLMISDETIKARLASRLICVSCGTGYNSRFRRPRREHICDRCDGRVVKRDDDTPETIQIRLETYRRQTAPLLDFYRERNLIINVNNETHLPEALKAIRTALEDRRRII